MSKKVKIIIAFCVGILLLGMVGLYSIQTSSNYKNASALVAHTHDVLSETENLLSNIKDLENLQTLYLLNGDAKYYTLFSNKVGTIETSQLFLKQLTIGNVSQQTQLGIIHDQTQLLIDYFKKVSILRKNNEYQAVGNANYLDVGAEKAKNLIGLINLFKKNETTLRLKRLVDQEREYKKINSVAITGTLLSIIVLVIALIFFIKIYNRNIKYDKQLNESNSRFLNIFKKAPIGISLTNLETREWEYVNEAFTKLFGYTPEDIIGKTSTEVNITTKETQQKIRMLLTQNGFVHDVEGLAIKKSGEEFWVLASAEIIEINDIKFIITSISDINERQKKDEQINQLLNFQNTILNGTDYSIITTSAKDGLITSFNKGAEQMLGYRAEEVIGKASPALILDPGEIDLVSKRIAEELKIEGKSGIELICMKAALSDSPNRYDTTYIHKNGTQIKIELSLSALRDKENNVVGYLNIAKNITELKIVEEELIKSRKYFQHIFDINSSAILITEAESGRFTDVNKGFEELFKIKREDAIGKTSVELNILSQENREKSVKHIKENGYGKDLEMTLRTADGEMKDVFFNTQIIEIDGKKHFLTNIADVSKLKKIEKELLKAKEDAVRSNLLKDIFLANMSHEIRTPMNAIIGFTDLLLKRDLGIQEMDYVKIIKTSGENLLMIINDILDISKINSGMMIFEEHPISIPELFNSLNAMLSHKAKEKNLKLTFDFKDNIPGTVIGDPVRLTQIVINLVGNAIKFTDKGSIDVFAKTVSEENEVYQIEFSVKDTGIGIPENKLNDVLERFRQADSSTTRNYGGTGLGLSIAKQLVELQGGTMRIKSKVGAGSLFSFTLPFKKAGKIIPVLNKPKSKIDFAKLSKLDILLIEDNPVNTKFVLSLFADHNIKTDIAENGKIAIEKIKNKHFDVLLMDIEMPEMNGYDTTLVIRNELKKNIPIIAMTAHMMAGEKEKCIRMGMNDYISKPINSELLFEKISNVTVLTAKNRSTDNSKKIVNLDFLVKSMGAKKTVIKEIIDMVLTQITEDVAIIDAAVAKGDYSIIKSRAHRMKSTISVVGVPDLENILGELENLRPSGGEIEKIKALNNSLNLMSKQVVNELQIEKLNYI